MFKQNGAHKCTWDHNTLNGRLMIDFVIVLSDLWSHVLDAQVKGGAEQSLHGNDLHHQSLIQASS